MQALQPWPPPPTETPQSLIRSLSEDILNRFSNLPLLDPYDVYQNLMGYWDGVMQDDVYLITTEGWIAAAQPRPILQDKQKKIKETPDLTIKKKKYKTDLIPPALIIARYFPAEQDAIEILQTKKETAEQALEEYVEEHGGEDSPLADALNDAGKITAGRLKAQLTAVKTIPHTQEERDVLTTCAMLMEERAKFERAVKKEQAALDQHVLEKYADLTETDIKTLVIEDKWFARIQSAIAAEVHRLTQALTGRVQELETRYAHPLPELERHVETLSTKVAEHLQKMGITEKT